MGKTSGNGQAEFLGSTCKSFSIDWMSMCDNSLHDNRLTDLPWYRGISACVSLPPGTWGYWWKFSDPRPPPPPNPPRHTFPPGGRGRHIVSNTLQGRHQKAGGGGGSEGVAVIVWWWAVEAWVISIIHHLMTYGSSSPQICAQGRNVEMFSRRRRSDLAKWRLYNGDNVVQLTFIILFYLCLKCFCILDL